MIKKILFVFIIFCLHSINHSLAQGLSDNNFEDDFTLGGDIFSDFNEDLEANQVMEDERFYRYGRFFSVNLGLGQTQFTGNREKAYTHNNPSYQIAVMYFLDFFNVFIMGFEYSQHTMIVDTYVNGHRSQLVGSVVTSFLRPFVGFRFYVDTADLGTALTYSNPYFVGRIEYWYQTNKFPDNDNLTDESGGGMGTGIGFGLEFPIEMRKSYLNFEFLYHIVNFFDANTTDYRQIEQSDSSHDLSQFPSDYGYDDLTGDVLTLFVTYNISW